jgi:hypothetical protein
VISSVSSFPSPMQIFLYPTLNLSFLGTSRIARTRHSSRVRQLDTGTEVARLQRSVATVDTPTCKLLKPGTRQTSVKIENLLQVRSAVSYLYLDSR